MSDTYYEEKELQNLSSVANRSVSRNVSNLEHWLSRLFWVLIVLTIANVFSGESMEEMSSGVYTFFTVVGGVCAVLYAVILLKLSSEEELYRKSAYYWIAAAVIVFVSIVAMVVGELLGGFGIALGLLLLIAATVVSIIGEYYEFRAHANVLQEFDVVFSEKWQKLWKYYLGMTIGMLVATIAMVLIPLLGMIAVVVFTVGLLVVSVLKLVYIYQMAKLFRAQAA